MEATTRPFSDHSVTITLSLSDDELLIEHNPESVWVNDQLKSIAQQILLNLKVESSINDEMVETFVDQVLSGLPEEGGCIPLENVEDFFSVNYPRFRYRFSSFNIPFFVFESKQRYVA
tara:strand:- start:11725 stop:12078 length:354 start_codon:yes stop_codon:yes gene_type:complete